MTRTASVSAASRTRRNRWGAWAPPVLAVALVAVLICLAAMNVVVRASRNEAVDGVLWLDRAEGITAAVSYMDKDKTRKKYKLSGLLL